MVKVSVIVTVYNLERYIIETLESISNQTYKDIEIIVIDDASVDNSNELIKKYIKKDSRIRFFKNKKNKGKAGSVNFALKKTKGDFIIIFDGDDIMPEDRIEKQVKFMQENRNIAMSYGNMIKFDEQGREELYSGVKFKEDPLKKMKRQMNNDRLKTEHTYKILDNEKFIPGTSVMIRKKVFDSGIKMDTKIYAASDYDLWLQIIGAGFKIKKAPIVGLKYRLHQNQMSEKRDKNLERTYIFNKLKSGKYFR